jgi:hypothetical protein
MDWLQEEETRKTNHMDRDAGTIINGYTTIDQITTIDNYYFLKQHQGS